MDRQGSWTPAYCGQAPHRRGLVARVADGRLLRSVGWTRGGTKAPANNEGSHNYPDIPQPKHVSNQGSNRWVNPPVKKPEDKAK